MLEGECACVRACGVEEGSFLREIRRRFAFLGRSEYIFFCRGSFFRGIRAFYGRVGRGEVDDFLVE